MKRLMIVLGIAGISIISSAASISGNVDINFGNVRISAGTSNTGSVVRRYEEPPKKFKKVRRKVSKAQPPGFRDDLKSRGRGRR